MLFFEGNVENRLKPINSSKIAFFFFFSFSKHGTGCYYNCQACFFSILSASSLFFLLKFCTSVINCYLNPMPACILLSPLSGISVFLLVSFHNPALASSFLLMQVQCHYLGPLGFNKNTALTWTIQSSTAAQICLFTAIY